MVDDVETRRRFFAELSQALIPFVEALKDESPKKSSKLEGRSYVEIVEPPKVAGYPVSGRIGREVVERFRDRLATNDWGVLATEPGRTLFRYVTAATGIGEPERALEVAHWFRHVPRFQAWLWPCAVEAAIAARKVSDAARFASLWLVDAVCSPWRPPVKARPLLEAWIAELPGLRDALAAEPVAELVGLVLSGEALPVEADIRSERCAERDLWFDPRFVLRSDFRLLLLAPKPSAVIDVLEQPPMSASDYWFAPDFEEPGAWPLGRPETRVLLLIEALVGLGHAEGLATELSQRAPRLSVIAAISGHPRLVAAAEERLDTPGLGIAIDRLRKRRPGADDIVAVSDFGRAHPRFLDALADAIHVYSLTFHRGDALIDPLALFTGFDMANPGKLAYFFIRDIDRFPELARRARIWAKGERLGMGRFDATLYTECHLYRAALLEAAFGALEDDGRIGELRNLLERLDDEVLYFQSGSAEGFCNDTRRMAKRLLEKARRKDLVTLLAAELGLA